MGPEHYRLSKQAHYLKSKMVYKIRLQCKSFCKKKQFPFTANHIKSKFAFYNDIQNYSSSQSVAQSRMIIPHNYVIYLNICFHFTCHDKWKMPCFHTIIDTFLAKL